MTGVCDELLLLLHVFCKRADGALREQDHEQQHEDPAEYAERGGEQKDTQGGEEILRGVRKMSTTSSFSSSARTEYLYLPLVPSVSAACQMAEASAAASSSLKVETRVTSVERTSPVRSVRTTK